MTRPILLAFIVGRLADMAARPTVWASGQEVSHVGTPERFADRQQAMLAELSGPGAGCTVPNGPITLEWAKQAVLTARKYMMP